MKHYPWFEDCIGAINGMHIHAVVPSRKTLRIGQGERTSAHGISWLFARLTCDSPEYDLDGKVPPTTSEYLLGPQRDRIQISSLAARSACTNYNLFLPPLVSVHLCCNQRIFYREKNIISLMVAIQIHGDTLSLQRL